MYTAAIVIGCASLWAHVMDNVTAKNHTELDAWISFVVNVLGVASIVGLIGLAFKINGGP